MTILLAKIDFYISHVRDGSQTQEYTLVPKGTTYTTRFKGFFENKYYFVLNQN